MKVKGGTRGAVNGMSTEGKVDTNSLVSKEVWAGTTYSVAACMIQEGQREKGFQTASGIYEAIWSDRGLRYKKHSSLSASLYKTKVSKILFSVSAVARFRHQKRGT